jgi:hypothetical protein
MRFDDFRDLVERLARDVPKEFEGGIVDIEVSPKTVPHPVHAGVYTLGECIPVEWSEGGANLQSRIVLFYGSFAALGRTQAGFDWRREAWDTLTHELRHHLEMRAHVDQLDEYDWAAEHNFARHEGKPFDPMFYRSGEQVAPGIYKVDDDVFIEGDRSGQIVWHGKRYTVPLNGVEAPAFLTLAELVDEPPGDVVLVLRTQVSLRDLWRRPAVTRRNVVVRPIDG